MEPLDPFSQLASCCFGRRPRSDGFRTQAIRNQYFYSPSMAHIGAGNTSTWPMGPFGPQPMGFVGAANQPQPLTQPYILYTQPVIIAGNQNAQAQVSQSGTTMALVQHNKSPNGQLQTISFVGAQPAPIHKMQSLIGPSQYAIYADSLNAGNGVVAQSCATVQDATIYESPRLVNNRLIRNRSNYLGPIAEICQPESQRQIQHGAEKSLNQQRPRSLNSEVYRRLELIEKQVDLTRDMDLVERHGVVITRAIEAHSLAPFLNEDILLRYQEQFLLSDEYVIRFIEIIKRPGQTLGLYIRLVHFESQLTKMMREGVVITKIESSSPVYTSQVLHVGDEILSINLIDIQKMSLDDVVTLMSIPKRLVLALRIPREREAQMGVTPTINQHNFQANTGTAHPDDFGQNYQAQTRLALSQQADLEGSSTGVRVTRPMLVGEDCELTTMRPTAQSASQSNFWDMTGNRQNFQPFGMQSSSSSQLVRPARVRSAFHMHEVAALDEKGNILNEPSSMFLQNLSRPTQLFENNLKPLGHVQSSSPTGESANNGRLNGQSANYPMSQLERQMATKLSLEEHHDESERFKNFSVDPEIATLEREAMNKERHAMHVEQVMGVHQMSYTSKLESANDGLFSGHSEDQVSRALPARTLPERPQLSLNEQATGESSSSMSRRPLLNNIRLGETPEQSSYFSSSIDAINRELKELRQQRMAISNNDSVR